MQQNPQIHLWCGTCWPFGGQHGSWDIPIQVLVNKHWWDLSPGSIVLLPHSLRQDIYSTYWAMLARWKFTSKSVKSGRIAFSKKIDTLPTTWCYNGVKWSEGRVCKVLNRRNNHHKNNWEINFRTLIVWSLFHYQFTSESSCTEIDWVLVLLDSLSDRLNCLVKFYLIFLQNVPIK